MDRNPLEELWHNYMKCPYDYPFNINQKPDKFGYFEVLIGTDGKVYEAPNGHQRGVLMMIARDKGITPQQVEAIADIVRYQEWLLHTSGVIMVWHKFYIGNPNVAQLKTIEELKELGHLSKDVRFRHVFY